MGSMKRLLTPFGLAPVGKMLDRKQEKREERKAQAAADAAQRRPVVTQPAPGLGASPASWEPQKPALNTILGVK